MTIVQVAGEVGIQETGEEVKSREWEEGFQTKKRGSRQSVDEYLRLNSEEKVNRENLVRRNRNRILIKDPTQLTVLGSSTASGALGFSFLIFVPNPLLGPLISCRTIISL